MCNYLHDDPEIDLDNYMKPLNRHASSEFLRGQNTWYLWDWTPGPLTLITFSAPPGFPQLLRSEGLILITEFLLVLLLLLACGLPSHSRHAATL